MSNSIRIIQNKIEWDSIIKKMDSYDFYHTYDYHVISKNDDETPALIVYTESDNEIALPLLIRRVFDTEYQDATTVYGYAGPVSRNLTGDFDNSNFLAQLNAFFQELGLISVFMRLNPFVPLQDIILQGLGHPRFVGNLVNINLTKSLEEQRSAYRRDTRSRVNKARRLCTVKKAETEEEIKEFIDIYTETMQKLEADSSYFFSEDYFFDFLKCDGFETDILLAIDIETQEVAAGSMYVKTNDIIQYHLSGTRSKFMKLAPSRLLIDEMRIRGTEEGYKHFNLGGGYNSREDALFDFKFSFSDEIRGWNIWDHIVDKKIYNELTQKFNAIDGNYFPAYRSSRNTNNVVEK
ncbi:MAG: peptidoglycan bridge formation glycyltransferase FemA/FemB family protein [Eudoraea sp.]|nr:peptidoglycan bridge formation glycyltransferase FemA/FemB family protein [Eudoraea sp.]